ncbi:MAG: 2-hydroxyacyl-CoA dehydratase, partial [Deltaproteobacteria bacterium]|nr:2-hydroxyacyl-CoA dehydratase [Deltaproteobacteria bacterium]
MGSKMLLLMAWFGAFNVRKEDQHGIRKKDRKGVPGTTATSKGGYDVETSVKSKALEAFNETTKTVLNPGIQSWKDQGGKAVGCFCSYVPEEIITAAGLLPIRIRATGNVGTGLADRYLGDVNCSFARNCFNMALSGGYDFFDGLVWINSCDHVRRLYDNWKRKMDGPAFLHLLSLPKKTGEKQVNWYREEMEVFKEKLETHFGVEITEERLWDAIRLHNQKRRLQRALQQLRRAQNPPITGAQMLAVMVAGTTMPLEGYNQLLRELLDEARQWEGIKDYRARLMIVGGILDDPPFIEAIESQGGLVVTDMLCFGSKAMWEDVDEGTREPLEALARYYVKDRPA